MAVLEFTFLPSPPLSFAQGVQKPSTFGSDCALLDKMFEKFVAGESFTSPEFRQVSLETPEEAVEYSTLVAQASKTTRRPIPTVRSELRAQHASAVVSALKDLISYPSGRQLAFALFEICKVRFCLETTSYRWNGDATDVHFQVPVDRPNFRGILATDLPQSA